MTAHVSSIELFKGYCDSMIEIDKFCELVGDVKKLEI